MRNSKSLRALQTLAFLAAAQAAQAAVTLGRTYDFSFEKGNLIRNWSFEQNLDTWFDESWNVTPVVTARKLAKTASISAVTGAYVGMFSGTNSTSGTLTALVSDAFPVESGTAYALSMYVWSEGNTSNLVPAVQFFSSSALDQASPASTAGLSYFQNTRTWVMHATSFTTPANALYARLVLVQAAPSQGGTLYFDDVVLEKGVVVTPRDRAGEGISFWNDIGQVMQSQKRVAGGGNIASSRKYLVSGTDFDAHRYPAHSYMPWINTGNPDFDPSQSAKSSAYNNGTNGMGTLGGFAYTTTNYAAEPGGRLWSMFQPGAAWQSKEIKGFSAYVSDLSIPSNPESPAVPILNGEYVEGQYSYQWNKDVEGRYSLAWSDREDRLIQRAANLSGRWVITRYEYYPDGKLKKILTPYDDPDNGQSQSYRQVVNYNSAGQVTSTYSAEKGLVKYYYNRLGQIRFVQSDPADPYRYTYTDYDLQNRPLSVGEQSFPGFDPNWAESRSTSAGNKLEHAGYIYDDLSAFQARLGFSYAAILPASANSDVGANAAGRLVCEFALNKEIPSVGNLPGDIYHNLVATFYGYNQYGEVVHTYKYIGLSTSSRNKVHHAVFAYDEAHRLVSESLYDNAAPSPILINFKKIAYDNLGRVSTITGLGGKFICQYNYYDWGGLKSLILGGNGTASQGTRIDYAYHGHGWVKEIDAIRQSTGELVFQQFLGYEDKAYDHTAIPTTESKFTGAISQQLYKYSNDLYEFGRVRLTNFEYDDLDRMVTADAYFNNNSNPLGGQQQIDFASLSWLYDPSKNSRRVYDDIGRITRNGTGGYPEEDANYSYKPGTFQLDKVDGVIERNFGRDASVPGNFAYDSRGRMIEDHSKGLSIEYGWDGLPIQFTLPNSDGTQSAVYNYYDAGGNRVGSVNVKFDQFSNGEANAIRFTGHQENWDPAGIYERPNLMAEYAYLQYQAGQGMIPSSVNEITVYYVFDYGKTNTVDQGESAIKVQAIPRSNGSPLTLKVVGVIKGSSLYYEVIRKYFKGTVVSSTVDLRLLGEGDRRINEEWANGSVQTTLTTTGLSGIGSSIGRINSGGVYEYYVKNHQGSIMKLVNDDGTFMDWTNMAFDYMAYGNPLPQKEAAEKVQPGYTGKEFDDLTRLTYFGARWYDPELSLWTSPDGANQYLSPYAKGSDPINEIDPDGNTDCKIYMAGVQGGPKSKFGGREIASTGYNIIPDSFTGTVLDISVVAYNDPGSYSKTVSDIRRLKKGCDETTIYAHSGGGNRAMQAALFHPSARPDRVEFYASPVTPGGKTAMRFMGIKTGDPNYAVKDPVSFLAAVQDWADPDPVIASVMNGEMSPWVLALGPEVALMPNPVNKFRILNPYNWYWTNHEGVKNPDRRSVGEIMEDNPWKTIGVFALSGGPQNTFTTVYATGFAFGMTVDALQHSIGMAVGPLAFIGQDIFDNHNSYDSAGEGIERSLKWGFGIRPIELGLKYLFK
jgi:RHS repeat-associated protein